MFKLIKTKEDLLSVINSNEDTGVFNGIGTLVSLCELEDHQRYSPNPNAAIYSLDNESFVHFQLNELKITRKMFYQDISTHHIKGRKDDLPVSLKYDKKGKLIILNWYVNNTVNRSDPLKPVYVDLKTPEVSFHYPSSNHIIHVSYLTFDSNGVLKDYLISINSKMIKKQTIIEMFPFINSITLKDAYDLNIHFTKEVVGLIEMTYI